MACVSIGMCFSNVLALLVGLLSLYVAAAPTFPGHQDIENQLSAFLDERDSATAISPLGCHLACDFLQLVLPKKVSRPGQAQYVYEESQYWSQIQSNISPTCRVLPTQAIDISFTLYALEILQCQFAVKSGGHASFAGASNINGGVTIDLSNMNATTVSTDKTQASYGPGNRWIDVYKVLQAQGLAVVGGRVADIGVGGLTLGGGISFFSGRFGWACDNVNNYEVVFADGSIHDVNLKTHPDLYFALRGGGNNFGIVTRFDAVAFPQGNMWGGMNDYLLSDNATTTALLNAYTNYVTNAPSDPHAAVILSAAYVQAEDLYIWAGDYHYGKPVVNPPIFHNLTAITPFASTNRIANLTDFTLEFLAVNPSGFRQAWWTLTIKNDATLMADIVAIWQDEVNNVKNATGILPSCGFQPLTEVMSSHFSQNGGNALGISAANGPLSIISIDFSYSLAADDARIAAASRNIINRSNATAWARGLGHPFIYQNYAAAEQLVFPSYGQQNFAKLKAVSKKYDPFSIFQKLQPGYFKL